jgi:uncharacterized membrane protein YphA (DoxX/SURF4 family)
MIDNHTKSIALSALRIGIGLVWIAAAAAKVRTPRTLLADSIRQLLEVSASAASLIAKALPIGEFAMGLLLIAGWKTSVISATSAALFFLFAFLIGRASVRNSLAGAGCPCFGVRKQHARALPVNGPKLVARNFLLAYLALMVALAGRCACSR